MIPFLEDRGRVLGIVGFVLAFLGPLSLVGVILSIVALVKARNPRWHNGFALAGVVVGAVVLAATIATVSFGTRE